MFIKINTIIATITERVKFIFPCEMLDSQTNNVDIVTIKYSMYAPNLISALGNFSIFVYVKKNKEIDIQIDEIDIMVLLSGLFIKTISTIINNIPVRNRDTLTRIQSLFVLGSLDEILLIIF